ncbi:MAG: hypothetical protein KGH91_05460 [Rhodospirillales bacterium]|nr:hypothetical protein [Rhodospirillales bacterium]
MPFLLVGCTPPPLASTVAYQHQGGKQIALVTPYIPPQESVVSLAPTTVAGTIGPAFGIVGGLIGGSIEADAAAKRNKTFTGLLTQDNFSAEPLLATAITKQLDVEGYTVTRISVPRPQGDFLSPYTPSSTPQLDVVLVQLGYYKGGLGAPYQPMVELKYRLIASNGTTTLAQGAFQYSGMKGDQKPDPQFNYANFADIKANPELADKALSAVLTTAGVSVAEGLN